MKTVIGALLIVFIVLKLTNVIAWSWWLVLSPAIVIIVFWIAIIWLITWLNK